MLQKLINKLKNPSSILDIVGQSDFLDQNGLITKMVQKQKVFNLIFYGAPGIGKSSLAKTLANDLKVPHAFFNPVIDSKKRLVEIIDVASVSREYVVIIDEIHRLNKDKQDILLPIIESNKIKLFATTTENPFFVINPALRSRCQIIPLKPLKSNEIAKKISEIVEVDKIFEPQAFNLLITKTNGDMRSVINTLEIINQLYNDEVITNELLSRIMQESYALGSSDGDEIHDLKSAFHKSLRGSDIDASLHYLARLILIGDFEAIYRRMLVAVHEDVGLANPALCMRVEQGINSCRFLGHPENEKILAHLVTQIAMSPKSNSVYLAFNQVKEDLNNGKHYMIPNHIRDSHYASAIKLGVHGYKYPHDFPNNYVLQEYLPRQLQNKQYYHPQKNEMEWKMYLKMLSFKQTNKE